MARPNDGRVTFGRVQEPTVENALVIVGVAPMAVASARLSRTTTAGDDVASLLDWSRETRIVYPTRRLGAKLGAGRAYQLGAAFPVVPDPAILFIRNATISGTDILIEDFPYVSVTLSVAAGEIVNRSVNVGDVIYSPVAVRDVFPFSVTAWSLDETRTVWADILSESSAVVLRAAFSGAAQTTRVSVRLRTRYFGSAFRMTHALWFGRLLRVEGVELVDRRRFLDFDLAG